MVHGSVGRAHFRQRAKCGLPRTAEGSSASIREPAPGAAWDAHIPLLHPDDQDETRKVWSDCLSTGCPGELSFRVRSGEGNYRWFLSRAEPLRGNDGTVRYWIGINLDIEERKQAEFYLAEAQRLAHTGSWTFTADGFEHWSFGNCLPFTAWIHTTNHRVHLRGLTRKPDSERAAALARHGVDVVKGDLDDEATLRRALAGAWGVFGVQNAAEAGVEREEAQGKRLATLAREAGVEHYVYTSVGSAHKRTGIPHFDNKWRIEETVRGLRFPSHVILRPVFFMENLLAPFSLQGSTLAWALGPGTKLQMIAVDDIGWFGARAFTDAAALNRREIDLAGDVRTMPEAAEILTEALGRPIAFAQTPIEQVRQYSKETALMLEWFERVGYSADIAGLEREFGRALTKLPDWARRHALPNGR